MSEPGSKPGANLKGPQGGKVGGHNLNPGDIHEFNPQPDIPGNQALGGGGGDLNPADIYEFNPQPDIPGNQALPGVGGGDPAMLKPDGGDPAMFKPDTGDPGADVEGAQPHMQPGSDVEGAQPHMHAGRAILIGLLTALLLGFGFLFFGPSQMVMGFFGLFGGGGTLCQGPGGVSVGNPDFAPADTSVDNPDFLTALVMWDNSMRLAFGQGLMVPAVQCGQGAQPMSAPLPGPAPTPTSSGNTGDAPAVAPTACVVIPNDGICSACENTDLDSASCVCNMNGVCDPGEGFNCGDCMPTQSAGGGKKAKCGDGKCSASEDVNTCPADCHQ